MKIQNRNIVLCGFMGSGKSSVGKQLAKAINRGFVDMDVYIEQQEKRSIKSIFLQEGEAYFRMLETEAITELSQRGGLVIATGGGTLLKQENVDAAKQNGIILMLDAPLAAIKERLKGDTTRPLLQKENPQEEMERIYAERIGQYRAAADRIIPAGAPIHVIVQEIIQQIDAL